MEPAASTWPANFVGASRPKRSSSSPSTTIRVEPTISARGCRLAPNTALSSGNRLATSIPARNPAYIASPPHRGVALA